MKNLIKFLLILSWMIVINSFSSQVGSESSKTSGFVVNLLTSIGINLDSLFGNLAHLVIRKSAHMFIYVVLVLISFSFINDFIEFKSSLVFAGTFSFFYSCLDEYHQTFVPMRSGNLIDIGVDLIGTMMGLGLLLLIRITSVKLSKQTFSDKFIKNT